MTFRAGPRVSPITLAARAKGRLDYALRKAGWTDGFARKVSVRGLGDNTSGAVLNYIATQLNRADLADPRYVRTLTDLLWHNPRADASAPSASDHGRYW